eukprot:s29_g48.t1
METAIYGSPHLEVDEKFTGVLSITSSLDGSSLGFRIPDRLPIMFLTSPLPEGKVSIYDARIKAFDDILFLEAIQDTWWTAIPEPLSLSPKLLELGAGFGAMGIGASFLGGQPGYP